MLRGVWRKGRNCLVNAERSGMEGINAVTQECPEEYDLWYLALWILKVKNKDLTPKGLNWFSRLSLDIAEFVRTFPENTELPWPGTKISLAFHL